MRLAAVALALLLPMQASAADLPICGEGVRVTCVVDGDTFWMDRVKYRIADIDAPEVSQPKCDAEAALGTRATLRLAQLLGEGPFELKPIGTDRYGRALVLVLRGDQDIGMQLVDEGLARMWKGKRRPWCESGR